jgi:RNA polymerase sigma-70 factor (ECF subfamily)
MSEFDAFFRAYSTPVFAYLRRLLGDRERASDVFQQAFLKAYTHFADRRTAGAERAWIFTIATNAARDEVRKRRRDPLRPIDTTEAREKPAEDPGLPPEDRELAREVLLGLEELPPSQREVFLLVRYHGFTFAEAAFLCGVSLSAAKMTVTRVHEKLIRRIGRRIDLGSLL